MTAGSTLTPLADRPAQAELPDESPAPESSTPPARRFPWLRFFQVLGVLVPLAIITWYAAISAPYFDGAMNLQVADNISNGLGFVRKYGGTAAFPSEIQTSGVFVFLAAGFIKLFGGSTLVYALPNILFLALLLVSVSLVLRRWPLLRIIGPSAVLFFVPGMAEISSHGYGEYVVAALVVAAFGLVGASATGLRRPYLAVGAAWVLVGAAFTVKVIALLAVPVLILGVIGLALARPALGRWKLLASTAWAAVPIGAIELQRLFQLGSISRFLSYWKAQISDAGAQAGVTSGTSTSVSRTGLGGIPFVPEPNIGLVRKVAAHVHLLSVATGIDAVVLVVVLSLPFLVLIGLFLSRGESWRTWLAKPGALLSVLLATYAGGYLVWWLAITPTAKAWLRRIIIALVVIVLLYLLLAGMAKDRYAARSLTARPGQGRRRTVFAVLWGAAGVIGFLAILPGLTTANGQIAAIAGAGSDTADQAGLIEQLAQNADQLAASGDTLYGNGWWSAPAVALYANVPLSDLSITNSCSPDIVHGTAYLIWDFYASRLASGNSITNMPPPVSPAYLFTQVNGMTNDYGSIWRITLKPGFTCPIS